MRRSRMAGFDAFTTMPAGIIGIGGVALALCLVGLLSFRTNDNSLFGHAFTLANYQTLSAPLYARVMLRSIVIAGSASLLTIVLAYPAAYFIAMYAGRRQALWLSLVTLPFWTSYLLRVFAWKAILGYNGALNSALMQLGLIHSPLQSLLYRPPAVMITLAHAYAAFAVLPIFASLRAIDPRLAQAGSDLGASPASVFLRIILPLSMPGVLAAFVIVFIPTLGDYATPALVGGLASTMIGNLIQAEFSSVSNWPLGCTLAVVVMLLLALPVLSATFMIRARGARP